MAQLNDSTYAAQMERLSDDDRRRVRAAGRTGAVLDDPRLAILASETTRRGRRSTGMMCLVLLAQSVIVGLYIGRDTGVLPAWAIVGFAVACAGFSVLNGIRWWRLHRIPTPDFDPLAIAALERTASKPDPRTVPDEDRRQHPDDDAHAR